MQAALGQLQGAILAVKVQMLYRQTKDYGGFMSQTILATGGAGYIGSHTLVELLQAGFRVVVLDDLSNASPVALERVGQIAGQAVQLIRGDVRDGALLDQIFNHHAIDAVIHFAGVKAVGESVANPAKYYDINVNGSLALFQAMIRAQIKHIVFSSTATVYGAPDTVPVAETAQMRPESPYAASKLAVERMLADFSLAHDWCALNLRYFNPVGAHPSALIGENPIGTPNNLFPYIAQVASQRRQLLTIFGDDYPTPDGTCVRDYIHVCDLARGHVLALEHLLRCATPGQCPAVNLSTGNGYSVREVLDHWQAVCKFDIAHHTGPRRAGDVALYYGDPGLAAAMLGWRAQYDLGAMCRHHWAWQLANPNGYNPT